MDERPGARPPNGVADRRFLNSEGANGRAYRVHILRPRRRFSSAKNPRPLPSCTSKPGSAALEKPGNPCDIVDRVGPHPRGRVHRWCGNTIQNRTDRAARRTTVRRGPRAEARPAQSPTPTATGFKSSWPLRVDCNHPDPSRITANACLESASSDARRRPEPM